MGPADAAARRGLRAASSRSSLPLLVRQVGTAPDVDDRPRVRAVRGLGRRAHRLGRSALARPDGVRRPRRARPRPRSIRGLSVEHRLARHPHHRRQPRRRSRSRGRCCSARSFASLVAVLVGVGALRVRGLLLAISTLAFAIAAQVYLFDRPFFTARPLDRADPARRHRSARAHAPEPRVLLLRARSSSWSCCCSSATSAAPASAA